MSAHTPGPWLQGRMPRASNFDKSVRYRVSAPGPLRIADVSSGNEADARLIAAAPALAEALRMLVLQCEICDCRNGNTADNGVDEGNVRAGELVDRARAALAAAGLE